MGPAQARTARFLALVSSLVSLGAALILWGAFDAASGELQFVERHPWVPFLGVEYFVGIDGLGLLMVLLTALLVPMSLAAGWKSQDRVSLQLALVMFLQSGLFGAFTALNFFHWFLFWELSLIPAFFLIKLWGGPGRGPAATQFFVYTMVGSVAMLLSFLAIFLATKKFDFIELAEFGRQNRWAAYFNVRLGWYSVSAETLTMLVFLGVFLGFAVKVPLIPFHTWLPGAYTEAPSSTTMLLTGVMSKLGVYGFLRILVPLFPEQVRALQTPLLTLAILTIVCSAAAAFAQKDIKRMLAYSSINHLGYCLLGVFAVVKLTGDDPRMATEKAAAMNGVFLQMFNHGITAGALFWFVSLFEERSGGLRGVNDFGGLRKVAPVLCGMMGIAVFASLGLPGLSGFVGEFLIFKGVFPLAPCAATLSTLGLLITAVFLLTLLQKVFHGPLNAKWAAFRDLTTGERWLFAAPIALLFVLGIYPQALVGLFNGTVVQWIERIQP